MNTLMHCIAWVFCDEKRPASYLDDWSNAVDLGSHGDPVERSDGTVLIVNPDKVLVVDTVEQWNSVEPVLRDHLNHLKVLGLDCEWVPNRRERDHHSVSLIQLATVTGLCVLVRIHLLSGIPASLADILADKSILKVGVACIDDGHKLFRDYGLAVNSCVDLRYLMMRCMGGKSSRGLSLKKLAEEVLNVNLDKNATVRESNWEAEVLSTAQVVYGAKDAVVGVFILWRLISAKIGSSVTFYPIDDAFKMKLTSCVQGIVDVPFKDFSRPRSTQVDGASSVVKLKGAGDYQKSRAYVARQSPLYHNCQMLAPDGQMLCTCDVKKATWYIDKGLAEKQSDNPLVVRLTFEPAGRPLEEKNYYTEDKLNVCVVCRAEDSYIRKSIIPHEYRKYFPSVMKEHRSHDVLLMCLNCHQRSNMFDAALKKQLAERCGAPLDSDKKYTSDHNLQQLKSAARALLNHSGGKCQIPGERLRELQQRLKDYFGVSDISKDLLQSVKDIDYRVMSDSYIPHGQKVVQHVSQNEGLLEFEKMWRQRFIDTMKPQHLPSMWSVDHHHYQLTDMEYQMKVTVQTDSKNLKFLKS